MNILFIHQNFPAQFKNLAPALVNRGHDVATLTLRKIDGPDWNGVRVVRYGVEKSSSREIHSWISDFETKVIRGEACLKAAMELKSLKAWSARLLRSARKRMRGRRVGAPERFQLASKSFQTN